jgi:hypothetical protein
MPFINNGGNSSSGGTVKWFVDAATRDAYYTANPSELKEGISVGVGDPVVAWTYDGTAWIQGALAFKGDKGDSGEGVPTGGSLGQILSKASGSDYDTDWEDIPGMPTGEATPATTYAEILALVPNVGDVALFNYTGVSTFRIKDATLIAQNYIAGPETRIRCTFIGRQGVDSGYIRPGDTIQTGMFSSPTLARILANTPSGTPKDGQLLQFMAGDPGVGLVDNRRAYYCVDAIPNTASVGDTISINTLNNAGKVFVANTGAQVNANKMWANEIVVFAGGGIAAVSDPTTAGAVVCRVISLTPSAGGSTGAVPQKIPTDASTIDVKAGELVEYFDDSYPEESLVLMAKVDLLGLNMDNVDTDNFILVNITIDEDYLAHKAEFWGTYDIPATSKVYGSASIDFGDKTVDSSSYIEFGVYINGVQEIQVLTLYVEEESVIVKDMQSNTLIELQSNNVWESTTQNVSTTVGTETYDFQWIPDTTAGTFMRQGSFNLDINVFSHAGIQGDAFGVSVNGYSVVDFADVSSVGSSAVGGFYAIDSMSKKWKMFSNSSGGGNLQSVLDGGSLWETNQSDFNGRVDFGTEPGDYNLIDIESNESLNATDNVHKQLQVGDYINYTNNVQTDTSYDSKTVSGFTYGLLSMSRDNSSSDSYADQSLNNTLSFGNQSFLNGNKSSNYVDHVADEQTNTSETAVVSGTSVSATYSYQKTDSTTGNILEEIESASEIGGSSVSLSYLEDGYEANMRYEARQDDGNGGYKPEVTASANVLKAWQDFLDIADISDIRNLVSSLQMGGIKIGSFAVKAVMPTTPSDPEWLKVPSPNDFFTIQEDEDEGGARTQYFVTSVDLSADTMTIEFDGAFDNGSDAIMMTDLTTDTLLLSVPHDGKPYPIYWSGDVAGAPVTGLANGFGFATIESNGGDYQIDVVIEPSNKIEYRASYLSMAQVTPKWVRTDTLTLITSFDQTGLSGLLADGEVKLFYINANTTNAPTTASAYGLMKKDGNSLIVYCLDSTGKMFFTSMYMGGSWVPSWTALNAAYSTGMITLFGVGAAYTFAKQGQLVVTQGRGPITINGNYNAGATLATMPAGFIPQGRVLDVEMNVAATNNATQKDIVLFHINNVTGNITCDSALTQGSFIWLPCLCFRTA